MAASQSTPPLDTWHVQPSIRTTMGLACNTHFPRSDSMASVSNKSLDRISQAIITHFTKNMLDRTFLGHFRRLAMTCFAPPTERKDKDDDKSSLQQSLTAACKIMMALPPSKYHHDSQKVFPPFQGTMFLAL